MIQHVSKISYHQDRPSKPTPVRFGNNDEWVTLDVEDPPNHIIEDIDACLLAAREQLGEEGWIQLRRGDRATKQRYNQLLAEQFRSRQIAVRLDEFNAVAERRSRELPE